MPWGVGMPQGPEEEGEEGWTWREGLSKGGRDVGRKILPPSATRSGRWGLFLLLQWAMGNGRWARVLSMVVGTRLSLSLPSPPLPCALLPHPNHLPSPYPGPISPQLGHHMASPRPWVLASMISLMRPEPTLFLAASFTLYHVPHLRLSSLKDRSPELMNTSFHSSLLSTEYCSTKPAREVCLAQGGQGWAWDTPTGGVGLGSP